MESPLKLALLQNLVFTRKLKEQRKQLFARNSFGVGNSHFFTQQTEA